MTEAHSAAGTLAESWFPRLLEASSAPLIVVDRAGAIVLITQGALQLFGYQREELLGRQLALLIPPSDGATLIGRRQDGSEIAIEISANSLETAGGPFTLTAVVDLTARRRSEDELRRSAEDLAQFAYIASHDLQEPLRMVASYSELLAQRYQGQLDERADKYIHYAVDGAKRMQQLLADLLTYSRVGSQGKPLAAVSAEAVLSGVVASLNGTIRRTNAHVSVGSLPNVLADRAQLAQLFQHLIGNALKFQGAAAPLVEIGATALNDCWQFSVRDNGIGIDSQHRERIFQMFQRLHERDKYEGSGAGLAIAKRIVERHGGRIWLESEPRVGSTFFFTLSAVPAAGQP